LKVKIYLILLILLQVKVYASQNETLDLNCIDNLNHIDCLQKDNLNSDFDLLPDLPDHKPIPIKVIPFNE